LNVDRSDQATPPHRSPVPAANLLGLRLLPDRNRWFAKIHAGKLFHLDRGDRTSVIIENHIISEQRRYHIPQHRRRPDNGITIVLL
jgi:hypothetical protein